MGCTGKVDVHKTYVIRIGLTHDHGHLRQQPRAANRTLDNGSVLKHRQPTTCTKSETDRVRDWERKWRTTSTNYEGRNDEVAVRSRPADHVSKEGSRPPTRTIKIGVCLLFFPLGSLSSFVDISRCQAPREAGKPTPIVGAVPQKKCGSRTLHSRR